MGVTQNEGKPKRIKSIDLTGNMNPTINLDQRYSKAIRNTAKSPVLKPSEREKSSDSKKDSNYNLASGTQTSKPSKNSVLNGPSAQKHNDKQNLNNLMKITLSLCVDKLGKTRPASNNLNKEYKANLGNNGLCANPFDSKTVIKESERKSVIDKSENISNFNININNNININHIKYTTPITYDEPHYDKNVKDAKMKTSQEKIAVDKKVLSRNKQINAYIKPQSKDMEITKNVKTNFDMKMFSSYNNVSKVIG